MQVLDANGLVVSGSVIGDDWMSFGGLMYALQLATGQQDRMKLFGAMSVLV